MNEIFASCPVTICLIAANLIISLIGFSNEAFLNKAVGWPYYTYKENQWHRFISAGFLHADWAHLIFNMFTLFFFGRNIEYIFTAGGFGGAGAYLALYFLGMIAADIPSYFKHRHDYNYRSLGASGAVSAVVFANLVFSPWESIYIYGAIKLSMAVYAVLYVIYCIYAGKRQSDNVNHDAHLWGSVFGLAFTLVLVFALRPEIMPVLRSEWMDFSFFGR